MKSRCTALFIRCVCFIVTMRIAAAPLFGTTELPSRIDNQTLPFFPKIISQVGEACSNASSIGYVLTYELNAVRNLPASRDTTTYPYFNTYNFLNDGSEDNGTHTMFVDAWGFARDNGIMNTEDFGSIQPRSTKWVSGYPHYLHGMRNRVATIDSLSFHQAGAFDFFKRFLYDHGDGSVNGGIFLVTVCAYGIQDTKIASGPEKGKYIVHSLGTRTDYGGHTLTVTGYNDSIIYDYNYDGNITTDIDINKDGTIDIGDSEKGAFICANTWGVSNGDSGFMYIPYRLFVTPQKNGGSLTNQGYFITVRKDYHPVHTLKIGLTHANRNALSLSVGVTADSTAETPSHMRLVRQFDHAGGALPMCGEDASPSIEIGLDISDLADSLNGASPASYFLLIDAKDSAGTCTALSFVDYAAKDSLEIAVPDMPRKIVTGSTLFRIAVPTTKIRQAIRHPAGPAHALSVATGRGMVLYLPCGEHHVSIVRIDGSVFYSRMLQGTGDPLALPVRLPSGLFIIRIADSRGCITQTSCVMTLH